MWEKIIEFWKDTFKKFNWMTFKWFICLNIFDLSIFFGLSYKYTSYI